jgi:hypothetical protein
MNRTSETKAHASLTEAMEAWWEGAAQSLDVPYVGDNMAELMATAALTVLLAMADVYETMLVNNELKDAGE